MNQTLTLQASKSLRYAIWDLAWGALRVSGRAIRRSVLAFVAFWNIPVLGNDETPESRNFRTIYHI